MRAWQAGCVGPQVVDAQRLEQQPESLPVGKQPPGPHAERGGGDGGVGEVSLRLGAKPRLRAHGRIPAAQALYDVHVLEHVQVGGDGGRRRYAGLVAQGGVLGDGLQGGCRGDVSCERGGYAPRHVGRAALLGDADLEHGVEVLVHHFGGCLGVGTDEGWPAAAAYGVGQGRERRVTGARLELALEQPGKRHGSCGKAPLPQRHGAHVHAGDAARTAVRDGVLGRGGGAREDEQPPITGRVDGAARSVPGGGDLLPLVDHVGAGALQGQRGVGLDQCLDVWVVQVYDALAERQGRPGLAAPLGSPDLDRAEGGEQPLQALVDEARAVRLGLLRSVCDHG